jgi:hypothetical protein
MNIIWKSEADSFEYFCKISISKLRNSNWNISSHPLNNLKNNCIVIKSNSTYQKEWFVHPPKKQLFFGIYASEISCKGD